jgi:four helix bundle protein
MALQTFENLEVWKRSCRLAVELCAATRQWEDHALRDQLRRSAISIPSNIAEGAERDSKSEFVRFLRISKGSCGELRTQLYIAKSLARQPACPVIPLDQWIAETKEISAMIQGLINSIERRRVRVASASSLTEH